MKIIQRIEWKDKVVGQQTCSRCTSVLELTLDDLQCKVGFGNEVTVHYVEFVCPVCRLPQTTDLATYAEVASVMNLKRAQTEKETK